MTKSIRVKRYNHIGGVKSKKKITLQDIKRKIINFINHSDLVIGTFLMILPYCKCTNINYIKNQVEYHKEMVDELTKLIKNGTIPKNLNMKLSDGLMITDITKTLNTNWIPESYKNIDFLVKKYKLNKLNKSKQ
jgi:hypothetical protein